MHKYFFCRLVAAAFAVSQVVDAGCGQDGRHNSAPKSKREQERHPYVCLLRAAAHMGKVIMQLCRVEEPQPSSATKDQESDANDNQPFGLG